MTRDRWTEIKPLLDLALDLPRERRQQFVARKCGHDAELRRELESYLELEPEIEDLLNEPLLDLIAGRPPEYRAGRQIGAFELEGEIARGGMGVVYRAKRVEGGFEQKVAIKVLKRGFDTGDFVRRFRGEQQILANLEHPHIARLLDGGATEDGLPYLVMELIQGVRLDEYCRHSGLDLPGRLRLFDKICDAVHTAHRHMVIHCDLKPSNILVTDDGEPKLLDFGIAKVMRQDPDSSTRSFSVRLGTPPFASPEQTNGDEITSSSDVYGLGAVLFLLLTNRYPRKADYNKHSVQLPSKVPVEKTDKGTSHVALPIARSTLRGDLDAIVLKAMSRTPTSRYPSVAALRQDLERHRLCLPVQAQPYTWFYALRLFVARRRRELWIGIGALSLIFAVNLLWFLFQKHLETVRAEEMVATALEMLEIFDSTADESPSDAARTIFQNLLETPTLGATDQQALLYDRLGRFLLRHEHLDEARPFLERALALRRTAEEPISKDQASSLNNLAQAFRKAGELDQAAHLLDLAADLYRRHPHWDEAEALDILHNRAGIERARGNTTEALNLYLKALERRRIYYGEESREVARTLNNLGSLLLRMHRLDEAEPYLEESVSIREDIYGKDHANVATGLIGLASLRESQGRTEEAIEIYERALDIRRIRFGEESPAVARVHSALGFTLLGRGEDSDLAEARRRSAVAARILNPEGEEPTEAGLVARRNYAAVLLALRDLDGATRELTFLSRHSEKWSPANAWRIADIDSLRGAVAVAENRFEEARRLFAGTVETITMARGAESRYTREARERLQRLEDLVED